MSTTKKDQGLIPKTEGLRKDVAELGSEQQRFRDAVERPTHIHTRENSSSSVASETPTLVGDVVSVNVPAGVELKVSVDACLSLIYASSGYSAAIAELCDISSGTPVVLRRVVFRQYFGASGTQNAPVSFRATVKKKPNSIARFQLRLSTSGAGHTAQFLFSQYWEVEFKTARMGK